MYLENSVEVGEKIEARFTEMCKAKGMSEEERLFAFNQNVKLRVMGLMIDVVHGDVVYRCE